MKGKAKIELKLKLGYALTTLGIASWNHQVSSGPSTATTWGASCMQMTSAHWL